MQQHFSPSISSSRLSFPALRVFALLCFSLYASLYSLVVFGQSTLMVNINGYSVDADENLQHFTALQFTGDTLDRVFTEGETLPADEGITRIDGAGLTLLPGLIDAHGHILSYGLSLLRVDLTGTESEQEAVQRVQEFQAANPDLAWIQGRGWNQVLWDTRAFPSAASLDGLSMERPVWLSRVDGHAGWANSAALEIAGVGITTPDPDGGQIIRDEEGRPTGVLVDNAMRLVTSKIPALTQEEQQFALQRAMTELTRFGLTGVHDAGISAVTVQAYKSLLESGPLPIRVYAMLAATDPDNAANLAAGYYESEDQTLSIRSVKIVADGALGSRGAALIDDYSDMPGHRGLMLLEPERLTEVMETAMRAGFQVNTHAIGDRANQAVLDNYAALIAATDSRELRHRIEHAQVLTYQDILRFSELGVIPSMQATHATSDKNMAEDRLGPVRIQGAYAWRKLADAGAVIANGSDFPVESPNPFFGLHAAITRQDHDNEPPGGWYPEERMTRVEALTSFTRHAAYAAHQENLVGALELGKKADFILVDRDLFSVPESQIWQTEVLQTWVGGRRVH
ncbi:MAG: amidohydrolase [Gammaproteobacteria bacterium]|nr:amidohydrolase [Pseudomonadales bacterium]